jgi:glycine/D-amino acid oxidase-like deaminating enzyme
MRIAIIGAGFCGLAAAWHLLHIQGVKVSIFDAAGIGGGASGVATGLLHPYIGEQGRRSWQTEEGLKATLELLGVAESALRSPVCDRGGILRIGAIQQLYPDLEPLGEKTYLIRSGITVYAKKYLKGLWKACEILGAKLLLQKVEQLEELKEFDSVVIAAGAGIFAFEESCHLRIGKVKGQVLTCRLPKHLPPLERSLVAKGYIAKEEQPDLYHLGATYEKGEIDEQPCLETALQQLKPKAELLYPGLGLLDVLECRAGIRVNRQGHYIPLLEKIDARTFAVTAMGSRGLLYHALFAKMLKEIFISGKILER